MFYTFINANELISRFALIAGSLNIANKAQSHEESHNVEWNLC